MAKRRPSGDGMVRKREDGRWEGRIVVGHKKNGTPIFQHAYAHTQKELTEKLHQNIERYQDVELTEDSRMTLGEWLDRWLTDYKENTVRPGTLTGYRSCIENYIKPQLGGKQVSLVTAQDVQKLYRRLKENGRVREHPRLGSTLSDTTINRLHAIFHQAMSCVCLLVGGRSSGMISTRSRVAMYLRYPPALFSPPHLMYGLLTISLAMLHSPVHGASVPTAADR